MFYPDLSPQVQAIVSDLKGRKVAVLGHLRPDGDCIGSQVGLCRVLRALGLHAVCVNADPVPRRLEFLIDDTPFHLAAGFDPAGYVAITVDCADQRRTGDLLMAAFPEIFANIDHHISNTRYARLNLIESDSAATGEILAGTFLDNGWPIDDVTAQALYVGIATDTGQFRFPSTTRRVFVIGGNLISKGANPSNASLELYERESLGKMQLLQRFLASLRLECDGRICIGILTQEIFDETGTSPEDSEGLVDFARSIDGVDVACILEERDDGIKGSLRCKNSLYRVDKVAQRFNGGGHSCASGFNTTLPLEELYTALLDELQTHLCQVDTANGLR
jgi:bifunctional oligoribonuclease and PAP phosphatase NrnA